MVRVGRCCNTFRPACLSPSGGGNALCGQQVSHWRNLRHAGFPRLPEVVGGLLRQPCVGMPAVFQAQPALKAKGHHWGNGGATIENAGKGGAGYAKLGGCVGNGQPQGW